MKQIVQLQALSIAIGFAVSTGMHIADWLIPDPEPPPMRLKLDIDQLPVADPDADPDPAPAPAPQ